MGGLDPGIVAVGRGGGRVVVRRVAIEDLVPHLGHARVGAGNDAVGGVADRVAVVGGVDDLPGGRLHIIVERLHARVIDRRLAQAA